MTRWRKQIRGAFGIGLAWGTAWLGAGLVLLAIVGPDAADVPFPLGFGLLGFLAGLTFSAVLALAGRRRRFDQLSLPRFAGWGAAGGVLFAVTFVLLSGVGVQALAVLGPIFAASGAACAAGSLGLARKAAERPSLPALTATGEVPTSASAVRRFAGGRHEPTSGEHRRR